MWIKTCDAEFINLNKYSEIHARELRIESKYICFQIYVDDYVIGHFKDEMEGESYLTRILANPSYSYEYCHSSLNDHLNSHYADEWEDKNPRRDDDNDFHDWFYKREKYYDDLVDSGEWTETGFII